MRAAVYEKFGGPISVQNVATPHPGNDDIIVEVGANGICRSDWHAWVGHDSSIVLPHVPGHECAGTVVAVGKNITRLAIGDRVVIPFSGGCGTCVYCSEGLHNVCDNDFQPGFSDWGAFAEFVRIGYADVNTVLLPESIGLVEAASMGCRFMTSFGAIVDRAMLQAGERVVVFGCGGVGLSAIMIAAAVGAEVIAVDVRPESLDRARLAGAHYVINSADAAAEIVELTRGGVHVSIDAIGSADVARSAIDSLRKRGRHIQVGLLPPDQVAPPLPLAKIISRELTLSGSHGLGVSRYPELLDWVVDGRLRPGDLVSETVTLDRGIAILTEMDSNPPEGVSVVNSF